MNHYSLEDWCDFVRNLSAPDVRADMQAHLESGCRSCGDVEKLWRDVLAAAQAMTNGEPRESTIRLVKATFAARNRKTDWPRSTQFARKIFDDVLQPGTAGLRASMAPSPSKVRQLLYDASPYVLDIRMEQEPRSPQVYLVGQIVYSSGTGAPLKDVPVVLKRGPDTLQEVVTNPFGEFHFKYQADRDLVLAVNVGPRESICIGLPDFTAPGEGVCA